MLAQKTISFEVAIRSTINVLNQSISAPSRLVPPDASNAPRVWPRTPLNEEIKWFGDLVTP